MALNELVQAFFIVIGVPIIAGGLLSIFKNLSD
jgi:hypothetical protein